MGKWGHETSRTHKSVNRFLHSVELRLGNLNLDQVAINLQNLIRFDELEALIEQEVYVKSRYRVLRRDNNGYFVLMANGSKHRLNDAEINAAKRLHRTNHRQ